jgi:cell cycle checkpoint protein
LRGSNHQKVIKPQFFQSFREERDNGGLLDTAAGHIAKKGVAASISLSERSFRTTVDEPAWGGVPSKLVLATELVPMMVKIQGLSNSQCYGDSFCQ